MKVLIVDGNFKSSLACLRSLGEKNIDVVVLGKNRSSLCAFSKYARVTPKTHLTLEGYFRKLTEPIMVFPVTDVSMVECFKLKKRVPSKMIFPFGSYRAYQKLSDKADLFRLAEKLDIPCPKTIFSPGRNSDASFDEIIQQVGYPAVLKPHLSRIATPRGWLSASVKYAQNPREFRYLTEKFPFNGYPFLIQERIQGPGIGVFLLTNRGKICAVFAHRRIREKPPSGGVSVVCESIEPPVAALDAAKRLFEHVGWTGVGMCEFKLDQRDNTPKLMEVNARFWGSLPLAVSAGVDFPYLLYQMAMGEKCTGPDKYKVGVRSRWELGDLDHLLIRLKNKADILFLPEGAPSKGQAVLDFGMDFFRPSVTNEVFKWADPGPFLFELKEYLRDLRN